MAKFSEIGNKIFFLSKGASVVSTFLTSSFFQSGAILVFSGLLDRCANEDEFAFVLAHELSHCIVGHNVSILMAYLYVMIVYTCSINRELI